MSLQIGFANKFYTLWDVTSEKRYATDLNGRHYVSGINTTYTYYQNLSTDLDKAKEKAINKGCKSLDLNTELRGKRNSFESYKKTEEQKEIEALEREAKEKNQRELENQKALEQAKRQAKYQAFISEFLNGRGFTTCSNFSLYDYDRTEVTIKMVFEPKNEYEKDVAERKPYGVEIVVPVNPEDLIRREYKGYEYFVLKGFRSMKNKEAFIINNELKFS